MLKHGVLSWQVRTQTIAVLRQAWVERVQPCLVLNKIDRLITDLMVNPLSNHPRISTGVPRS